MGKKISVERKREQDLVAAMGDNFAALRSAITRTWEAIGHDVEAAEDEAGDSSNEGRLEMCLEHLGSYGDSKDSDKLVSELIDKHGYNVLLKYLDKQIRL